MVLHWLGVADMAPVVTLEMVADVGLWFTVIYTAKVVITAFFVSPMRKIPGPWYTNLTGLERKYYAWQHQEHHYFIRMFAKYGPLVRVGPGMVGVGEAAMFRKMMSSHDLVKSKMYEDFAVLGENMFTTRRPEFNKTRRRQIGPAFTASYVHQMAPLLKAEGVDELCRLFDAQIHAAERLQPPDATGKARGITNVYYAFTMMATDVISSLAYGHRFGAVDMLVREVESPEQQQQGPAKQTEEFADGETSHTVLEYMIGSMELMRMVAEVPMIDRLPSWMRPPAVRHLYRMRDKFIDFTVRSVARYREQRDARAEKRIPAGVARNDIISAYLAAHDPETGATMTDMEIASESTVLLAAGTDTTANTMVHAVGYLLRHPDKMARVQHELRQAMPVRESVLTDPAQAPYLAAVIHETLRLRASTSGVWPRDAPRPTGITLGGWFIPPGTVLCGSIGGVHLNPETWPEPQRFMPERFLGPAGEARKKNIVAFSAGIRICPGRHLAMLELVLGLATILRRYEFAPVGPLPAPAASADFFTEVDEVCHVTTTLRDPDRDCRVFISHSD
ncbi:hypothetical protein H4R19_001584 [Coemansia spiralis]|nr:hypothetical protein H4R19_001584 [Coemansia spiralis]